MDINGKSVNPWWNKSNNATEEEKLDCMKELFNKVNVDRQWGMEWIEEKLTRALQNESDAIMEERQDYGKNKR